MVSLGWLPLVVSFVVRRRLRPCMCIMYMYQGVGRKTGASCVSTDVNIGVLKGVCIGISWGYAKASPWPSSTSVKLGGSGLEGVGMWKKKDVEEE